MPKEQITISIKELENQIHLFLVTLGVPKNEATTLTDTILDAEIRGIRSHGLLRLPYYEKRIKSAAIQLPSNIELVKENGAIQVIDGHDGLGPTIAKTAMNLAIEKASDFGVGVSSVRNSQHFGTAGYYANLAAKEDMVGLVFTNASPRLAPWGGMDTILGNNPWSISLPTAQSDLPFTLDIANSIAAAGKIRKAIDANATIPDGWALDKEGNPTNNPVEALQGILLPMGLHKGYGITLAISLLTSELSQGVWDREVKPIDQIDKSQGVSHLFIALNISAFTEMATYQSSISEKIKILHDSKKLKGVDNIYYPGERGGLKRKKVLEQGSVQIDDETYQMLFDLFEKYNLEIRRGDL